MFVTARVKEIGDAKRLTTAKQSELFQRLIRNPGGTFLWISLLLHMIENSGSASQGVIDQVFTNIPSSSDAIYEEILAQSKDVASAKDLLHIIVAAVEPMFP